MKGRWPGAGHSVQRRSAGSAVPRTRIECIVTTDTALRLVKYFRTTPKFWKNMQTNFNLKDRGNNTSLRTGVGSGNR